MKAKILEILNCTCPDQEKFNKLFDIYRKLEGHSPAMVKRYNAFGYSKDAYESLVYEVKKLVGIRQIEVVTFKGGGCGSCGNSTYTPKHEERPAEEKAKEKESETSKKEDDEESEEEVEKNSFREDYPFLNDPNCPEELKILAADKISFYQIAKAGHEKLLAAKNGESDLSEEELAELSQKVAEADLINDQIHDEFEHFKQTGEILGKHPIFKERNLKKKIELMTGEEKVKRINALQTGIRRDKDALNKANSDDKKAEIEERLEEKELELKLIMKSM